jgi:hypothetical protein
MKIASPVFEENGCIPPQHTCDGPDINPPLNIEGVPAEAKSLVLIMDDPDVPPQVREDRMWDHWIVFNIPPDITQIIEGQEPTGIHGQGTSGNLKYHGPCPPDGEHRYIFKLYALDTELDLEEGVTKEEVETAMEGHVLEGARLVGKYKR